MEAFIFFIIAVVLFIWYKSLPQQRLKRWATKYGTDWSILGLRQAAVKHRIAAIHPDLTNVQRAVLNQRAQELDDYADLVSKLW